jgi:hypothetical protein
VADRVPLHPAENRGYRELYAASRGLARHWSRLRTLVPDRATGEALGSGVAATRRLLDELPSLTTEEDLHGGPAALGLGARLADLRNLAADRFLERNQAVRLAALEPRHIRVLLAYLATVGEARGAAERAAFCRRWETEIEGIVEAIEAAAAGLGADPDAAIEPVDSSAAGRAGQRVAASVGAVGEWVDRRAAHRR